MKTNNTTARRCLFATAALLGLGLFGAGNTYADDSFVISVIDTATSESCYIYSSFSNSDSCDASYGSYDTESSTLTLGSGVNNKKVHLTGPQGKITVKSSSDLLTNFEAASSQTEVIFDLGDHTFTIPKEDDNNLRIEGGVIFESGTFNLDAEIRAGDYITINGGTITLTNEEHVTNKAASVANNITINGGTLNMPSQDLVARDTFNMNGGNVNITNTNSSSGALRFYNAFNMTGGNISINFGQNAKNGIGSNTANAIFTISGGNLTINGANIGIDLSEGGAINFNGGTTTISNSKTRSIMIEDPLEDPENAISFGENMGIKESNLYVFWSDGNETDYSKPCTGIATTGTVTITEGYTARKVYGKEKNDTGPVNPSDNTHTDPSDTAIDEEGTPIKVPDTGAMDTNNKTIAIVVSALTLPVILMVAYALTHLQNRSKKHIHFIKKGY